jgi:uncharacterized protein YndB with AHSA1/START domain
MAEIKHYLRINVSPGKVYKAITEQDGLSSWWTDQTIADSKNSSILEFFFQPNYHNKMILLLNEINKKIVWECIKGDPEWIGTKFSFDLEKDKDTTILRFSHYNWGDSTDFFANCNYHWGYYLRSLKLYCETGRGTPFINP